MRDRAPDGQETRMFTRFAEAARAEAAEAGRLIRRVCTMSKQEAIQNGRRFLHWILQHPRLAYDCRRQVVTITKRLHALSKS